MLDAGSGEKISTFNPNGNMSLNQQRQRLPIFKWRNHILWLVENYQTVVLVGETGCGKSTQIPQYLHEADWTSRGYQVCVTQPRRVAAVTLGGVLSLCLVKTLKNFFQTKEFLLR